MKRYLLVASSLSLLCVVGLLSLSRAQSPQNLPETAAQPHGFQGFGAAVQVERDPATGQFLRTFTVPGVGPGMSTRGEIAQLVNQLRDATDDAKKTELTKKLETAVAKHFEEDMKAREAELAKLEERLKKLKDQLERRRKAKADILQLELKVLVNEAEGLGFSGGSFFDYGGSGGYPGGLHLVPPGIKRSPQPADSIGLPDKPKQPN